MNVFVSDKNDVGIAIGKGGCTIEKARLLIRRFYGYEVGEVFPEEGVAEKSEILDEIWEVIEDRAIHPSETSYTTSILTHKRGLIKPLKRWVRNAQNLSSQ